LLQYLIPEKILFPYVFLTKSKTIRFDSLIEGSSSQKRRSFRYIRQTPLLEDSLAVFAKVPKISPYRYVFKGKIAVLINGNTSSAAVQLAATLHHYRRAYFFGEETGGRYSGGNGGVIFTVVLPHSSIKLQLPMLRYYNQVADCFPNRGLYPDFFIPPTVDNLLNNQDEVLQKALEWLMNH
ncbi:MAG: S41 family peptidase, partial [Flammeovirgaceae bacterium]|nr:S41 family peptidase [Flammeovirgaceae bacterium]